MAVYDLNNISFLMHDIEKTLTKINSLYRVTFNETETTYYPKRIANNSKPWTSTETNEVFNKIIPEVKSLHKDMYSIIESISKAKKGIFKKEDLEKRFDNFKEFRILNNKFKHFNNQQADINLTQIVVMEHEQHLIDIYVNFKYNDNFKTCRYCEFIDTFLKIMKGLSIIRVDTSS